MSPLCRPSAAALPSPFLRFFLLILLKKYSRYIHPNIQKHSRFPLILHLLRTQSKVSSTAQLSCSNNIPLWLRKTKHYNCCNTTLKDSTAAHRMPTDGVAKKVGSKEQTAECRTSLIAASLQPLMDIFDHKKKGLLETWRVKSLITQGLTLTFALVKGQWQDLIKSDNKSRAVCR